MHRSLSSGSMPENIYQREGKFSETIFFPFNPAVDDVHLAHSVLGLDGTRWCLGFLPSCPFCPRQR